MSLDAPLDDTELRRIHAERTAGTTVNGVVLGPDSPLHATPRAPSRGRGKASARTARREEHAIQTRFFAKVNDPAEQLKRPELALCFAVPNAARRTPRVAQLMKEEGLKPGPPDVWLPVPRGGFHGLVFEFKGPTGSLSPEQASWLAALERHGWYVRVQTHEHVAWAQLIHYLDSPHDPSPQHGARA